MINHVTAFRNATKRDMLRSDDSRWSPGLSRRRQLPPDVSRNLHGCPQASPRDVSRRLQTLSGGLGWLQACLHVSRRFQLSLQMPRDVFRRLQTLSDIPWRPQKSSGLSAWLQATPDVSWALPTSPSAIGRPRRLQTSPHVTRCHETSPNASRRSLTSPGGLGRFQACPHVSRRLQVSSGLVRSVQPTPDVSHDVPRQPQASLDATRGLQKSPSAL